MNLSRPSLWMLASLLTSTSLAYSQNSDDELVKQLSNPVASLISVPFQMNWDTKMGPLGEGSQFKINFQPVVPLELNDDWNLIVRTIVPYVSQEDVFTGPLPQFPGLSSNILNNFPADQRNAINRQAEREFNRAAKKIPVDRHQEGLSDITQSFFFAPKDPVGGWIMGFGPALLYPTATDDLLGTEKWAAGPTALVLRQRGGWTFGVLANHLWSYAGNDDRSALNATFVQPFLSYATKTKTTIGINSESTYDWTNSQWSVPINLMVSQLVKIGAMPIQFSVGGRYYAEGPEGGPEWGARFVVTFLFPGGQQAAKTSLPSGK